MLQHEINTDSHILTLTPSGELSAEDFINLTRVIDQYNEERGPLRALMIITEHFPGWDSFGALLEHLKFVRREARQLQKIAAVTDSGFLNIMPRIVDHFVQAEVRHFDYSDREQAQAWLQK